MTALSDNRDRSVDAERRRLTLLVRLAASAGDFSPKLAKAVGRATDSEVQVLSDLVERGLSVPDLVHVLQGAHLIVGDDELYEKWIFPHSRKRLSSHHRAVDKESTPDYGMDGPLVRESLHGKAFAGTWVQLERTKATFQPGKMPSWHDVVHIKDFVIYRITGKNVGPWGLSALVDTKPMLLQPRNSAAGEGVGEGLAAYTRRRMVFTESDEEAAGWSDLLTPEVEPVGPAGDLFAPPDPDDPEELLPDAPFKVELGPGLFGSLALVNLRVPIPADIVEWLDRPTPPAVTGPSRPEDSEVVVATVGKQQVPIRAAVQPTAKNPTFLHSERQI